MRGLNQQERAAIESVARRFSATWEQGSDPPDAYILAAGKRVAVDVTNLNWQGTGEDSTAKPRLRFDKVATRLIERLRASIGEIASAGTTVLLTVTAPIRLASKTGALLEERIQTLAGRRPPGQDETATIHGNYVRIRLVRDESERAPALIGFVHHPETDPLPLLDMACELLARISAGAGLPATRLADERWLVVTSAGGASCLEAYRAICSQLQTVAGYQRILMVLRGGRVEVLTG